MTRHAALVVAALGRSPYEDEIVTNSERNTYQTYDSDSDEENRPGRPYVQQYDARGHPINLDTRHRERMEVQAGNEVLQVAGIVETFSAREEREGKEAREKYEEKTVGLWWNRNGYGILTAGMWGVSGLRRRVILYESYSQTSFFDIVGQENHRYGLTNLIVPGLAAASVSFAVASKWRRIEKSLTKPRRKKSRTSKSKLIQILIRICGRGVEYTATYMQLYAILQQLNLLPKDSPLFPTLSSYIPFTATSLIQYPTPSNTTLTSGLLSGLKALAPITSIYIYNLLSLTLSTNLFHPCYALALKPVITPVSFKSKSAAGGDSSSARVWSENLTSRSFLQALRNNGFAPRTSFRQHFHLMCWKLCRKFLSKETTRELLAEAKLPTQDASETHAIRTLLEDPQPAFGQRWDSQTATVHRNEALRILEGGATSSSVNNIPAFGNQNGENAENSGELSPNEGDWDGTGMNASSSWNATDAEGLNNSESTQVSWASMISVEVVDHPRLPAPTSEDLGTANGGAANASAELHNVASTNPNPNSWEQIHVPDPKPEDFHITYLTMLPSILLSRTLSTFLARTITLPFETIMIRTVASSFLSFGPQNQNILGQASNTLGGKSIYPGIGMPRGGWRKSLAFVANLMSAHFCTLLVGGVVWGVYSQGSMYLRSKRIVSERGPVEIEVGGEGF